MTELRKFLSELIQNLEDMVKPENLLIAEESLSAPIIQSTVNGENVFITLNRENQEVEEWFEGRQGKEQR